MNRNVKSLCCTRQTDIIWYVNYTLIKKDIVPISIYSNVFKSIKYYMIPLPQISRIGRFPETERQVEINFFPIK